ncbi:MAG: hypothetical protein IBJ15_15395 [Alphaproteobacteria bacterium]|nr:hypothetical protein [Alphaproteobacteria bacterium]
MRKTVEVKIVFCWISIGLLVLLIYLVSSYFLYDFLPYSIRGPVISGMATIVVAVTGVGFAVWQLERQAQNIIRGNRFTETTKRKQEIYKEILSACSAANQAQSDFGSYITSFEFDLRIAQTMASIGQRPSQPRARIEEFVSRNSTLTDATVKLMGTIEQWEIIDLRMNVFRIAFSSALHELSDEFSEYLKVVLGVMPKNAAQSNASPSSLNSAPVPWHLPPAEIVEEAITRARSLSDKALNLGSYISDFQVEMQNLLLADLFNSKIPPRKPIDPSLKVITLDCHDELKEFFETKSAWGRSKAAAETRAKDNLQGSA